MTLDNMTGMTEGSYTGGDLFCKSQLITCNRVKECNGVCPFEDALKHADKGMNEQTVIEHDREWIIGCIKHDGFIKTDRFDKANQIILDALKSADRPSGKWLDYDGKPMEKYAQFSGHCSVCGEWSEYLTDYCGNCGAYMADKGVE